MSTCCTLHNVCEKHGEAYEEPGQAILQDNRVAGGGAQDVAEPTRVRQALTEFFFTADSQKKAITKSWTKNIKGQCSPLPAYVK